MKTLGINDTTKVRHRGDHKFALVPFHFQFSLDQQLKKLPLGFANALQ